MKHRNILEYSIKYCVKLLGKLLRWHNPKVHTQHKRCREARCKNARNKCDAANHRGIQWVISYPIITSQDALLCTEMPLSPAFSRTCWSGFSQWWIMLLGWCFPRRGTSTSPNSSVNYIRLKAAELIDYKLALLVYKCRQCVAPPYLADELCQPADTEARCRLRSASASSLIVRRTRLSTVGDRAFPVAGPRIWNSLQIQYNTTIQIKSYSALSYRGGRECITLSKC